jgi:hypothetical protein
MSLHTFPSPAPRVPSSGGMERRENAADPSAGETTGNLHTQEMRRSIIAARVANILHLAACELYGTDQRLFEALRSSEKAILIQLASDVLQDLTPEKCWHCGTWLQHDMTDFCSTQCRLAQERG